MTSRDKNLPRADDNAAVHAFLEQVSHAPHPIPTRRSGRLLFAMDATASRQPTWDQATRVQADMFEQANTVGGLELQLCYFRGLNEFQASQWLTSGTPLKQIMTRVFCAAGQTQIARTLRHALAETRTRRINALVYVGDCMEESPGLLTDLAGQLGMLGVPIFVFQEGFDARAEPAFRELARLSGGAGCRFDANSAEQLRELLSAVAVFATGGRRALEAFGKGQGHLARQLAGQLPES